jgi:hypothetical protein
MLNDVSLRILQLSAQGYGCSQVLMQLALEARGEDNPGLVRAMAGLEYGCGGGRATCGALTAACCVLALYAGGEGAAGASERLPLMLQDLSDWFEERVAGAHGGNTCEAIVGQEGPAAARQRCGTIVADTHSRLLEILAANGLDPSGGSLDP